jgi:hypothetical protein
MLNGIVLAQELSGAPLAQGLRDFFGPLFLVILGIIAIFAIWKKKITLVFEIAAIGIVVAILLFRPDVIVGIGQIIAELLPGSGQGVPRG